MEIKLKDIAKMCDGKLFGNGEKVITSLFTDSRQASENAMFVPIIGENVDAHKFIPQVFEKGSATFSQNILESGDYVLVNDNRKALQELALKYRQSFNIPFIGVTGSVGKTTSKEMIALAISGGKNVHKTQGNANSQIGLPFTILKTEKEHECAVIEMGMSMPEEMGRISYCARVDMAVITNIGVSHIEFHGSREKIMEEKLHITDYFTQDNILFVNGDDDLLCTLKGTKPYKIITFGTSENCDYRAINIKEDNNGSTFTCVIGDIMLDMYVPVIGIHNVRNALASVAVAQNIGVDINKAIDAIKTYKNPQMRQEVLNFGDLTVIDDTYNASPDSAKTSIDVLKSIKGNRKIAILADMLELGDYSKTAHSQIGEYSKGIDFLITFGEQTKYTYQNFDNKEKSMHFIDFDKAKDFLLKFVKSDDVILIKGSRGMKMDRFVEALKENNT